MNSYDNDFDAHKSGKSGERNTHQDSHKAWVHEQARLEKIREDEERQKKQWG